MSLGSVKDFYDGKTIFITGGTGYIGRLLIAKLMRMGNLKEILLLSRPKKGKSNDERLSKILSGFLFEDMEKFDSKFRSKLRLVNGDMEVEDLGMSNDEREYIKDRVEIIIHGAATVRFDEELRKAIRINVRGTKNILDIATECAKLQTFVHISTAYSNCPRSEIKETFYEPPMDYRRALQLLDVHEMEITPLTMKVITPWPNTYTFTKAISEDMIRQYQDRLPIAIIRPSIVASTIKDPIAGYSDTILGTIGAGIGVGVGLIRVCKASPEDCLDMVPSDIVINYMLVIAMITARGSMAIKSHPPVYTCCTGNVHRMSNIDLINKNVKTLRVYPVRRIVWYPNLTYTSSEILFRFYYFLYHYIPAFFVDIILRWTKSKYRLMSIYSKIFFHMKLVSYFSARTWDFHDDRKFDVFALMSEEDHLEFPCQASQQEYEDLYELSVIGITKYFFKETDEDLEIARRKYRKLFFFHYTFLAVFYSSLMLLCYCIASRKLMSSPIFGETFM